MVISLFYIAAAITYVVDALISNRMSYEVQVHGLLLIMNISTSLNPSERRALDIKMMDWLATPESPSFERTAGVAEAFHLLCARDMSDEMAILSHWFSTVEGT